MKNMLLINGEQAGVFAAISSLVTAFIASIACIGPMLGIVLGVSGLGWLSSFSYLGIPASLISIGLLAAAVYLYTKRKSSCANRRKHQWNRYLLSACAFAVVAINAFEYIILPNLG